MVYLFHVIDFMTCAQNLVLKYQGVGAKLENKLEKRVDHRDGISNIFDALDLTYLRSTPRMNTGT